MSCSGLVERLRVRRKRVKYDFKGEVIPEKKREIVGK